MPNCSLEVSNFISKTLELKEGNKGAFKYYVIKEVGGWVGQMMMFDDKVGGWGWLNDDVSKKYTRKKNQMGGYEEMMISCLRWVCGSG